MLIPITYCRKIKGLQLQGSASTVALLLLVCSEADGVLVECLVGVAGGAHDIGAGETLVDVSLQFGVAAEGLFQCVVQALTGSIDSRFVVVVVEKRAVVDEPAPFVVVCHTVCTGVVDHWSGAEPLCVVLSFATRPLLYVFVT